MDSETIPPVYQCKRKTSDQGLGPANNVLGQRQIVICSAKGLTSISLGSLFSQNLGLHNITWAVKNYSLPVQVSGNNYGTLVYILVICVQWLYNISCLLKCVCFLIS